MCIVTGGIKFVQTGSLSLSRTNFLKSERDKKHAYLPIVYGSSGPGKGGGGCGGLAGEYKSLNQTKEAEWKNF